MDLRIRIVPYQLACACHYSIAFRVRMYIPGAAPCEVGELERRGGFSVLETTT
jgi:hypothetical protein